MIEFMARVALSQGAISIGNGEDGKLMSLTLNIQFEDIPQALLLMSINDSFLVRVYDGNTDTERPEEIIGSGTTLSDANNELTKRIGKRRYFG